jgi:glycerol kinase
MIAECAFEIGTVVITIGTGAFICVNTGPELLSSKNYSSPLAGYKHFDDRFYLLQQACSSAGSAIEWAKSIGILKKFYSFSRVQV